MNKNKVSRRDFLKVVALGAGSAALAACGQTTQAPKATDIPAATEAPKATDAPKATEAPKATDAPKATEAPKATDTPVPTQAPTEPVIVEVEITTSGWPVDVKKPEDIEADPTNKAYAEAVQTWLDANPGVTLTKVDLNIWDPQGIQAMVAGGTDCTFLFGPCVGGGWGRAEAMNAFVQGMLADISPAVAKYELEKKSLPHLWTAWSANTAVEGKYWAYPLNEYSPDADTLIYRKDWITEKGLQEPYIGWSFDEYKQLLKDLTDPANNIYGAGHPTWWLSYVCAQHGWDILTLIPQPNEPWHWTRDLVSDPRWVEVINAYRQMLFEDKSVYSDVALGGGDDEFLKLFKSGQTAFTRGNFWSMFGSPTDPTSFAAMADANGKQYADMFGVVMIPTGDGYQSGGGANVSGGCSFSPNASAEQIDKGVSLIDWMFFSKGLDMTKAGIWEITKDPRSVFSAFLYMSGKQGYEGVPGTAADAWGQGIIDAWTKFGELPYQMPRESFFPAEANPSPTGQAIDDQINILVSDPNANNIAELLKKGQDDYVAQLGGFASSISTEDFKTSSQKYYAYLDEYLKTNYATFYESRFKPFYEGTVLPAIS